MRILTITVVAGLAALAPRVGRADQRADLQAQGEQQAKEGHFADAIDSFKRADQIQQRANHACLIALAYTRRELWSQAQLWMGRCKERATATDPMPDWAPLAEKDINDRLETTNVAKVTIVVKPETLKASVTVSSFAPDEVFEPRTIHLPPGTHVIFAKVQGLPDRQQTLVLRDKTPQTVVIDYSDVAPREAWPATGNGPQGGTQPTTPEPSDGKPNNSLSTGLMLGGGLALVVGGVSHLIFWSARRDMQDAKDRVENKMDPTGIPDYYAAEKRFDRWLPITIGSYIVGAGLAVTGYLLRKSAPSETAISAAPLPEGGAFVSVGWSR